MTLHVFAGPSLRFQREEAGLLWYPPACAGDLMSLDLGPGDRVCLIDGAFDDRPAVRHKEILLLLAEGVPIFGGASMGALRAAELAPFGMIGCGRIFRAYHRGRLAGDDWVALDHAPRELGYAPLSEPLVDIAVILWSAVRARVLTAAGASRLLRAAAVMFYKDRTWRRVIRRSGLPPRALDSFCAWKRESGRSQKEVDARACLDRARNARPNSRRPPAFVDTPYLRRLAAQLNIDGIEDRLAVLMPAESRDG